MPDTHDPDDGRRDLHPYDDPYDVYLHRVYGSRHRQDLTPKGCLLRLAAVVAVLVAAWLGVRHIGESIAVDQAFEKSVYAHSTEVWTTTRTVELASMSAEASTSVSGGGSSFLGSGAFVVRSSEDQRLRYVERRSDGGYVMGSVPAGNAVIYEIRDGSREKPRIETQACHVEAEEPEHQAWIDEDPDRRSRCRSDDLLGYKTERLRVYVPIGTVVDAFSVDPRK